MVAARIRLSRSAHGTTSSLTLMPVCFSNFFSSGVRIFLSASMLGPWLEAQYVSVFGESLLPPPEDEPPPQPVTPAAMEIARVTAAAALMVRMRDGPFPGRKAVFENRTTFRT